MGLSPGVVGLDEFSDTDVLGCVDVYLGSQVTMLLRIGLFLFIFF